MATISRQTRSGSGGGSKSGGLKGMLYNASTFCYNTYGMCLDQGKVVMKSGYMILGHAGFRIATTSMLVLMPLFFEVLREQSIIETERAMIKDLMDRGFTEIQLYGMRLLPVIPLSIQNKMFELEPIDAKE